MPTVQPLPTDAAHRLPFSRPLPPAGRDMAEVARTASVVLAHEKEVALALQIARFSGGLGWGGPRESAGGEGGALAAAVLLPSPCQPLARQHTPIGCPPCPTVSITLTSQPPTQQPWCPLVVHLPLPPRCHC